MCVANTSCNHWVLNHVFYKYMHIIKLLHTLPNDVNSDSNQTSFKTFLPANLTWNLFSGLKICTYWGQWGAKSLMAQDLRMVCWSWIKMDENNVIQFTEWDGNTCNIIADHINISQNLQKLFILYKMDDFNFIHCSQPVQEMHYHSSHQYLTKPSKLVYSS